MWTYSPQKRQAGSAFALMYSLLLRSCKRTGAFIIHPCLPFCRSHCKQQGLFAPRALPRFLATAGPSAALSPFRRLPGSASYTVSLLPSISRPGRVGFLQLLSASLSSCCRSTPARVSRRVGQFATFHTAFASGRKARPLGYEPCGGQLCVHFRCGPRTRGPTERWLCR